MTDYPTEDLQPPATLDQPTWKPRHRVDPMRPANHHPITDDVELEKLYQDFYQERVRSGRTGPNLTLGLIVAVICLAVSGVLAWLIVINYGVGQ